MTNSCSQLLVFACTCWLSLSGVQAQFKFVTTWKLLSHGSLGMSVVLDCSTNDPNSTVELWKSFTKLTVQPGKLTKNGGVFTIVSATLRDSGMYKCRAYNQAGARIEKITRLFLIHVTSPTYKYEPEGVQFRQVGESVQFTLTATVVKPTKISWRRHLTFGGKDMKQSITAHHNITEKILSVSSLSSTLTLMNLQLGDEGHYEAVGTYDNKEYTVLFSVEVYTQFKFVTPWRPLLTGALGKSVTLDCTTSDPSATVELWKNVTKLTVQPGKFARDGGVFTIVTAKVRDAGRYKCKALNQARAVIEKSAVLFLSHAAPVLNNNVMKYIKAYANRQRSIPCEVVHSNPEPKISWMMQYLPYACIYKPDPFSIPSCQPRETAWTARGMFGTFSPSSKDKPTMKSSYTPSDWMGIAYYRCTAKNAFGSETKVFLFDGRH